VDGSGDARGYRTMMATMLAFGLTLMDLQGMAEMFEDIRHHVLSLPVPPWPLAAPDAAAVLRGQAVFGQQCASCHGVYDGVDRGYPNVTTAPAVVGTDATRALQMGTAEVEWVNASWFGADYPMRSTQEYLAPALSGVWATAPYFHNGSVPDLAGVLDSSLRPQKWKRRGSGAQDYDADRVGWRFDVVTGATTQSTIEGRKTYDTNNTGLSSAGHIYGDMLSAQERADVLEYLKTL